MPIEIKLLFNTPQEAANALNKLGEALSITEVAAQNVIAASSELTADAKPKRTRTKPAEIEKVEEAPAKEAVEKKSKR